MQTLKRPSRSSHPLKTFSITVSVQKVTKFHIAESLQARFWPLVTTPSPLQSSFPESWDFGREHIVKLEIRFSVFCRKALKRPEVKNCVVRALLASTGFFLLLESWNRMFWVIFGILEVLRSEWWAAHLLTAIWAGATLEFVRWSRV